MSKQEKLAALIKAVETYCLKCTGKNAWGVEIKTAYDDWRHTPDDPPPRTEMPECAKELVEHCESDNCTPRRLTRAVRDHYAQPLKLEVGKVYEDASGAHIQVFWKDKKFNEFQGVELKLGVVQRYVESGEGLMGASKLIREVPNG